MQLKSVYIENFRALKEVTFEMSSFSCVIGENNAGKSSLMQAIQLFLKGGTASQNDFYNKGLPITIRCDFAVTEENFEVISDEEQKKRLKELMRDGILTLTQTFPLNEKSKLTCSKEIPKDSKWHKSTYDDLFKGKSGKDLVDVAVNNYQELKANIEGLSSKTQGAIKELIENHVKTFSPDALETNDYCELPTGIEASIKPLLPEAIYIEAVKDVNADIKTSDKAVFGKILGLLLNVIQPKLGKIDTALKELKEQLNIISNEDGSITDKRFPEIAKLENTIQSHLQQNFPLARLSIKIPPPEVKTILQAAEIDVHDGGRQGGIETMGDGLKRAVLFSIFKAFMQLSRKAEWNPKLSKDNSSNYIILFEEPELYLHPSAQQILFESLDQISKSFQVVVTTHSPLFFSARKTTAFSKLIKITPDDVEIPYSKLISVDFKEPTTKEQFQILCYENNNVAFFAEKVVLVEGDTDVSVIKHISATLNSDWDFEKGKIRVVKVGGKGNFEKFRTFFEKFEIETFVIGDLDILVSNFSKLGLGDQSPSKNLHSTLMNEVQNHSAEFLQDPDGDKVNQTWKVHGNKILEIINKARNGETITDDDNDYLEAAQNKIINNQARLRVLQQKPEVKDQKQGLLNSLRKENVMILEKGCLEDYYPEEILGGDKVVRSERFRKEITSSEAILQLADNIRIDDGATKNEFLAIFENIFGPSNGRSADNEELVAA